MSTILCFSVNMGCCVYINEEKKMNLNGCNITKSEKYKGVWILSVPTVYLDRGTSRWVYVYFSILYNIRIGFCDFHTLELLFS